MKFILYVLIPLGIQLLIGSAVMFSHKPGGEFVGLGVMLLGMVAVPLTTIANWARIRTQPPLPAFNLINRTVYTSLVFPTLCVALYILAS